jgi:hypothetical protein
MDKRHLHYLWALIRPIKTWYLLVVCVVFAIISLAGLRANYQHMVKLRQAVYAADSATDGQNGNVEQALQQLRAYVGQHMNTNLSSDDGVYPPIQLVNTYERLVAAEQARINAANSRVYTEAQALCEAQFPSGLSGRTRIPCIEQYVKDHGVTVKPIPAALYMFDFVSPRWSPDVAGLSMLTSILFLLLAAIRFVAGAVLRRLTK